MSIVEFVESLGNEIHNPDVSVKLGALTKLSKYLSQISVYSTNKSTVSCLLTFYVNLLREHYSILSSIFEGISILIDFSSFTDNHASIIAKSIVQIDLAQLNTTLRLSALEILERLFVHHLTALSSLDVSFVRDYMVAVSGESDPKCVLHVMRINKYVSENLRIDGVYEELFETISAYFPIEFKTTKTTGSLTRQQLVEANKSSMLASPLFGAQLLPALMDKLSSDMKSALVDSLDILAEAVTRMNFADVLNYYMSFMSILYHQYKNRDPEIHQLTDKCLRALSSLFQQKSTESQLLEFSWHLFELCYSAVSNDQDALDFLCTSIGNSSRIWSAVMAYLMPKIIEKIMQEDYQDIERIKSLVRVLSVHDNVSNYPGLLDSANSKSFFIKATLLFHQIDDFSNQTDDKLRSTVLFRLLSLYSLFNVAPPQSGSDVNFINDRQTVLAYQMSLVTNAVNMASLHDNDELESALAQLVPRMVDLSLRGGGQDDNALIAHILQFTESAGTHSDISFNILRSFPESCLKFVLDAVFKGISGSTVKESASACLAVVTERSSSNDTSNDLLALTLHKVLECLLTRMDDISTKTTENIAIALSQLGRTTDESPICQLVNLLVSAAESSAPSNALVLWLCSILGRSSIVTLSSCYETSKLLYMLLGLILLNNDDVQLSSIVCLTFASIVNKCDVAVEQFVIETVSAMKQNALFLLCLLKSAIYRGYTHIIDNIVTIITDPVMLANVDFYNQLSNNLDILSVRNLSKIRHFVVEEKLFPNQGLFYEQRLYYLLPQKYQRMTIDIAYENTVRDMAMEIYLKLISCLSSEVLEMSLDEVMSTIVTCLPTLSTTTSTTPAKVSLQVQVLKSLTHLQVDTVADILSSHVASIANIIIAVARHSSSLTVEDRLCLVKAISWFLGNLQVQDIVCDSTDIRTVIATMLNDRKRVVRLEAVKAKLLIQ